MPTKQSDSDSHDDLDQAHKCILACISGIAYLWSCVLEADRPQPPPGFYTLPLSATAQGARVADAIQKAVVDLINLVSTAQDKLAPVEDELTEVAPGIVCAHRAVLNLAENLLQDCRRIKALDRAKLDRLRAEVEGEYGPVCRNREAAEKPGDEAGTGESKVPAEYHDCEDFRKPVLTTEYLSSSCCGKPVF